MLSDRQIKSIPIPHPDAKPVKVADAGGLFLQVFPNGSRLWRYRFSFARKERVLALGRYPDISLAEARARRDEARQLVARGLDPVAVKAESRAASDVTFEAVARTYIAAHQRERSPKTNAAIVRTFELHVFPAIGPTAINAITSPALFRALEAIEKGGRGRTARVAAKFMGMVFRDAFLRGLITSNPLPDARTGLGRLRVNHYRALTNVERFRQLLQTVAETPCHPGTHLAMRFLALTAMRTHEVRHARWDQMSDLDGPEPLWTAAAEIMKKRREHEVPLSRQAVELLQLARRLSRRSEWIFPSIRTPRRPMAGTTLYTALKRAGMTAEHTVHGFRSSFSTIMNEQFPADHRAIDACLAHALNAKGSVEAIYNRAEHLRRRRALMQLWADLVLEGAVPAPALVDGPRRRVPPAIGAAAGE